MIFFLIFCSIEEEVSTPISKQFSTNPITHEIPSTETIEPSKYARFRRDIGINAMDQPARSVSATSELSSSQGPSSPVSSTQWSNIPFATDYSLKEQIEATAKIEKELVALSFEKSQVNF